MLAIRRGEITAADVAQEYIAQGNDWSKVGNVAGAIFRGKEWHFTGRWKKNQRTSAHARMVRVWRLT
jgi:hypothetical protein